MEMNDHIVRILDISLQVAMMSYALFATVSDFHEDKGKRKVLSRAGKWGLLFLAVTSGAAILINQQKQILDDKRKAEAVVQEAQRNKDVVEKLGLAITKTDRISGTLDKTSEQLKQQTATMGALLSGEKANLKQTNRLATPLDSTLRLALIEVMDRHAPSVTEFMKRTRSEFFHAQYPGTTLFPDPKSGHEAELFRFASKQYVTVSFHKKDIRSPSTICAYLANCDEEPYDPLNISGLGSTSKGYPDADIEGRCDVTPHGDNRSFFLVDADIETGGYELSYFCIQENAQLKSDIGFGSYEDLRRDYVFIEINFLEAPIPRTMVSVESVVLRGKTTAIEFKNVKEIPCKGRSNGKCFIARYM